LDSIILAQLVLWCVLFLYLCVNFILQKCFPPFLCPHYFHYVGGIFLFLHLFVNLSASASTILQLQTMKLINICMFVCVCFFFFGGGGVFKGVLALRAVLFYPRNKTTLQIMGVSFNWGHTYDIKFTKGQKINIKVFAPTEDSFHAVIWYSITFQ